MIEAFRQRKISKTYVAISSKVTKKQRRQERWKDFLQKTDHRKRPMKISEKGLLADTHVEIYQVPEGSLLILNPKTGRTHQLRVQSAHHGYPIFGDKEYGERGDDLMRLHASALNFQFSGKSIQVIDRPQWKLSVEVETILQVKLKSRT